MIQRLLSGLALAIVLALTAALAKGAERPNVIIFLTDDQGWNDTSVNQGLPKDPQYNAHYRTPALERLAREGARFSQAYATPVCTPTRVSLLTGLGPARHGVTNWTLHPGKDLGIRTKALALPAWNCDGLQPRGAGSKRAFETEDTLPFLLRKAGYRTIHVGKAHLGATGTPGADPRKLGFDVNIAGGPAGQPGSFLGTRNFSMGKADRTLWDVRDLDEYHGKEITVTQAITDKAIAEIERAKADGKPFLLHLGHFGVHTPIEPAAEFAKDYEGTRFVQKERDYATMVADVDKSMGRILDALDRLGLAKDTMVVFLSDNGGYAQRVGGYFPRNLPLRSGKGSAYEGGLRTPLIIRWPGVAKPGSLVEGVASVVDLMPTAVTAAGAKAPEGIDGRDLAPLLRGEKAADRALIWYYPHVWGNKGPGIEPHAAIRRGDLKAVHFFENGKTELYDLAKDPGETKDLAGERKADADRLREELLGAIKAGGRELPRRL
ncbi:MAG: sulfatase [Opitutia bacterium]